MAINFNDIKELISDFISALLIAENKNRDQRQGVVQLRFERLLNITNDYEFSRDLLFNIGSVERDLNIDLSNSFNAICQMLYSGKIDRESLLQVDPILKRGFIDVDSVYLLSTRCEQIDASRKIACSGFYGAIWIGYDIGAFKHLSKPHTIFVTKGANIYGDFKSTFVSVGYDNNDQIKLITMFGNLKPFFSYVLSL